jgi:hypothetical protein
MKKLQYLKKIHCLLVVLGFLATAQMHAQEMDLFPMTRGYAVGTCFSGGAASGSGTVMAVMDVRGADAVAPDVNWSWTTGTPLLKVDHRMSPFTGWMAKDMGEIFGIALDDDGDIYVTSTTVYGGLTATTNYPCSQNTALQLSGNVGNGYGNVYKINRLTGAIGIFAQLPNTSAPGTPYAALGNICYDSKHNQFYVTNHDDGKIYILHGTSGLVLGSFDPFVADGGTAGFAPLGERLWGIGYFKDSIYYCRWRQDAGTPGPLNEIWAVHVNAAGAIVASTNHLDYSPTYRDVLGVTQNMINPISDIEFSTSGEMLIVERVWRGTPLAPLHDLGNLGIWAHNAHVSKWTQNSATGVWGLAPVHWAVGQAGAHANAAGGIDWGYRTPLPPASIVCDATIWASADALHFTNFPYTTTEGRYVYGWERMSSSGVIYNDPTNVPRAPIVIIDADNNTNVGDKTQIGDIDIFRPLCEPPPPPCGSIKLNLLPYVPPTTPKPCCWSFTITNTAGPGVFTSVTATTSAGVTFSDASASGSFSGYGITSNSGGTMETWTPPSGTIPVGTNGSLIFCLDVGTTTSQSVTISFYDATGRHCDTTLFFECKPVEVEPDCAELENLEVTCLQAGGTSNVYQVAFDLHNYGMSPSLQTATIIGITPAVTVTPTVFSYSPPIPVGNTSTAIQRKTFTISGPLAVPGTKVCLRFEVVNPAGTWCCKFDTCIVLPECPDCCDEFTKVINNMTLSSNSLGVLTMSGNWTVNQPVIKATASIVAVDIKRYCPAPTTGWASAMGDILPTTTSTFGGAPYLTHTSTPPPFASTPPEPYRDYSWGITPAGVPVTSAPMTLKMQLPPLSSWPCFDSVRVCVKFSFTNVACVTCDTMICFQIKRKKIIIHEPWEHLDKGPKEARRDDKSSDAAIQEFEQPVVQTVSIAMTDATTGRLNLTLPAVENPEDGYRIIKLVLESGGATQLTELKPPTGAAATIVDQKAMLPVSISPGDIRSYSLRYTNPSNAALWDNYLTLHYVPAGTSDTLTEMLMIPSRTPQAMTGDSLAVDLTSVRPIDVRTYALFFSNGNRAQLPVHRVLLRVRNGSLIAAGPFEDSSSVLLAPTLDKDRQVLLVPNVIPDTTIVSGQSVRPIYVTVSGTRDNAITIEYTTFDSLGYVLTNGVATLTSPISAASGEDPVSGPERGITRMAYLLTPFPNPAATAASLQVHMGAPGVVTITVTDALGIEVGRVVSSQRLNIGDHVFIFPTGDLPTGSYFVRLESVLGNDTRRFEVVH